MSSATDERLEELRSHFLEDEVDDRERAEIEAWMARDADAQRDGDLERALMLRLGKLPHEEAPRDFARSVMAKAPALPGGTLHQIETTLRRLLVPGMAVAAGMAAVLFVVSPTEAPRGPVPVFQAPRLQVATLIAGPAGAELGGETLYPDEMRAVFKGQRLLIPEGSNASLLVGDGIEVEARGGSEMVLDPRVVHLRSGGVHVRVEPGIGHFVVNGPQASAEVVGTEFEVTATSGSTEVSVSEGIVEVRAIRGGSSVQLLAGGHAQVEATRPGRLEVQGPTRDQPRPLVVKPAGHDSAPPSDQSEELPLLDSY